MGNGKWLSIKDDICSQGEGGLFSAEILRTRKQEGSSDADVGFFLNLWCVRTDEGG